MEGARVPVDNAVEGDGSFSKSEDKGGTEEGRPRKKSKSKTDEKEEKEEVNKAKKGEGARKRQRRKRRTNNERAEDRHRGGFLMWEPLPGATTQDSLGILGQGSTPRETGKTLTKLLCGRVTRA